MEIYQNIKREVERCEKLFFCCFDEKLRLVEDIFGDEYPSKPDGHNWPRSYEQYKSQVGGLQQDMDAVYETLDEYEEAIDELEKIVSNLRVEVARKRDK